MIQECVCCGVAIVIEIAIDELLVGDLIGYCREGGEIALTWKKILHWMRDRCPITTYIYLMCNSVWGLIGQQAVQIKRGVP